MSNGLKKITKNKKVPALNRIMDKVLRESGLKFTHKTKALQTYARSGLTKRVIFLLDAAERALNIPRENFLPFVLFIENIFRNTGNRKVMARYFETDDISYRYLTKKEIINAYRKINPKTLPEWSRAIKIIDKVFRRNPYVPIHIPKPPRTVKYLKIKGTSSIEWRKELKLIKIH